MRPITLNQPNRDRSIRSMTNGCHMRSAQVAVDFDAAIGRPDARKVFEDIERRGLDRLQEFLRLTEEPIDAGMRELPHPSRGRNLRIPCRGRSEPYIRDALVLSRNTVSSHVRHIYRKIDVRSKQEFIEMVETRRVEQGSRKA